jgi:hypothetical protein
MRNTPKAVKQPRRMPIKPITSCRGLYPCTMTGRTTKRTVKVKKVR